MRELFCLCQYNYFALKASLEKKPIFKYIDLISTNETSNKAVENKKYALHLSKYLISLPVLLPHEFTRFECNKEIQLYYLSRVQGQN